MSEQNSKKAGDNTSGAPGNTAPNAGMGNSPATEKAKDFKGAVKSLVSYLKDYRAAILASLILSAGSAALSIFAPVLLGNVTTAIFNGVTGGRGIDFGFIGNTALLLLALYLISAGLGFIQGFLMSGLSLKVAYRLRRGITEKIGRLPLAYFDARTHGETLSRLTNDVDTLSTTLNQSLSLAITAITTLIGIFFVMFTISPQMALATLVILPLAFVILRVVVGYSQKFFRNQQENLGHLNGHVEEMYGAHGIVKAFNGEEKSISGFDGHNENLRGAAWKAQFFMGIMMPIMGFVGNIGYVIVAIFGGYLAIHGRMTVGGIQAFIQYVRTFMQNMAQGAEIVGTMQQTAAAAERVFEFLSETEEKPDEKNAAPPETVNGAVSFENVSFGYSPDKIVLRDFSANVSPGKRVAVVGPTGAGKTTLVKLLMRFYDVIGGRIMLDGRDIRGIPRDGLRSLFGMALQDTWLFEGTIMDNIRYGRLDATDAEVTEAAKAAHADRFIRSLPGGYQMALDEDAGNISQGQKQLLTIARAILADPKILILDEATSSVDTRTEALIQKAMEQLMRGRTCFIIAHRLSTVREADTIFVMDKGQVVEQGTHNALLERNGFYAELYRSQFENAGFWQE
jgi:ATP-binding cassette subfamily B protein